MFSLFRERPPPTGIGCTILGMGLTAYAIHNRIIEADGLIRFWDVAIAISVLFTIMGLCQIVGFICILRRNHGN